MNYFDPTIKPEKLAMMQALLGRADVAKSAAEAFKIYFPDAPEEMIFAAVHHTISEGIEATVDWLAAIEAFLRDPSKGLDYGAVCHVIYHLYNWQQLQALMPMGRVGMKEQLLEIKKLIQEGDVETAVKVLAEVEEALDGTTSPPDFS